MPGPSVIRVPWRDSDTKSTHSTQSWPVKNSVSKSQEMRDRDFLHFGHDDKPDAGPCSGASRTGRNRWGKDKQKRSSSDSSNYKDRSKSARTESSTSIAVNQRGDDKASKALLAETARQLAEMKLKSESLELQLEE